QISKLPPRLDEKTSDRPSGAQAGSRSQSAPLVILSQLELGVTIHKSPRTLRARRPSAEYTGSRAPGTDFCACPSTTGKKRTARVMRRMNSMRDGSRFRTKAMSSTVCKRQVRCPRLIGPQRYIWIHPRRPQRGYQTRRYGDDEQCPGCHRVSEGVPGRNVI